MLRAATGTRDFIINKKNPTLVELTARWERRQTNLRNEFTHPPKSWAAGAGRTVEGTYTGLYRNCLTGA